MANYPGAHFLVGGRGYGKNALAAAQRRAIIDSLPIGKPKTYARGIGMVEWSCPKPTDPAPYRVGTNGWLYEQAQEVLQKRRTAASVVAEMEANR